MLRELEYYKDAVRNDTGFVHNNNMEVVEVGEDYAVMEATITDESKNLYGIVHGGFIFGLADSVCGLACFATGRTAVTVDANINYFHSAKSGKLKAVAKGIKVGKNISTYEARIYDESENLIAISNVNYYYTDNK